MNNFEAALENFESALEVTGLGMLGIFLFMIIFFFAIKAIDKLFPHKQKSE
jgi:Na+-transporting methylmalonyl-CoA/oxaloacetate decarboxylase gamma subunit